jgi:adenosine deaminase
VVPRRFEPVVQGGEGRVGGTGRGEQPGLAGSGSRRVGSVRIRGTKAEADPNGQARGDDDRRSTAAGGTYHLIVDLDRLRTLPKAELHLHLDGSLRPRTAVELSAEVGQALSLEDATARLVGPVRCADQAELLSFFDLPISLMQTAAALRRVTAELVETLADDGLTYAEIRWGPRLHLERGMSVNEVIGAVADGVAEAASRLGPRTPFIGLIVTALRSHPPAANVELARTAAAFGPPVIGFDLAGPEAAYPAPPHAAAFVEAAAGGLALTAHAGEVPGPERIREALNFDVRRIAHGVTAGEDEGLMALLRERDVTLDLCPTSNVQSGSVADLASHPLGALHRAGVSVTLSTDDRTVSNTTLTEEMARAAVAMRLTAAELAAIAVNAFRRAFGPRLVLDPMMRAAEQAWSAWAADAPGIS